MEQIATYVHIATAVCTLAAAIAALTPSPTDDGIVAIVRKVIDFLAFNWGHATNHKPGLPPTDTAE